MSSTSSQSIVNAMTVDVEDYFHVSTFTDIVRPQDWPGFESRVELNTYRLLDIFAAHEVSATFFILGWVAERHPSLVQAIQRAGYEVACHGYAHKLVYQSSPEEFRNDVRRARKLLEDVAGTPVNGYRAPSFSIVKSSLWARHFGRGGIRVRLEHFPDTTRPVRDSRCPSGRLFHTSTKGSVK